MTNKEMDIKTLSSHKAEYLKIQKMLKKSQGLPMVEEALCCINKVLRHIEQYERWKINMNPWDSCFGVRRYCIYFADMRFSRYDDKEKNKILGVGTDKEYLKIEFAGKGNTFSGCHDLSKEFFDKLVELTNPYYVDPVHYELYYTEENASNANDVVEPLYKEYKEKHNLIARERKIKELKEQIARMEAHDEE